MSSRHPVVRGEIYLVLDRVRLASQVGIRRMLFLHLRLQWAARLPRTMEEVPVVRHLLLDRVGTRHLRVLLEGMHRLQVLLLEGTSHLQVLQCRVRDLRSPSMSLIDKEVGTSPHTRLTLKHKDITVTMQEATLLLLDLPLEDSLLLRLALEGSVCRDLMLPGRRRLVSLALILMSIPMDIMGSITINSSTLTHIIKDRRLSSLERILVVEVVDNGSVVGSLEIGNGQEEGISETIG